MTNAVQQTGEEPERPREEALTVLLQATTIWHRPCKALAFLRIRSGSASPSCVSGSVTLTGESKSVAGFQGRKR